MRDSRIAPLDKGAGTNADVNQDFATYMFIHKIGALAHKPLADRLERLAGKSVKVILIVRRLGNRVVTYAATVKPLELGVRYWPPYQVKNCAIKSGIVFWHWWRMSVHGQNLSGVAKPRRDRSRRESVILAGALCPAWPPKTIKQGRFKRDRRRHNPTDAAEDKRRRYVNSDSISITGNSPRQKTRVGLGRIADKPFDAGNNIGHGDNMMARP